MSIYINRLNGGNITIGSGGGSSEHSGTRFTLEGGTVETYNITGTLDRQWMIDNGYYRDGDWRKTITQADIGNTVTSIGSSVFSDCSGLTSVTIPDSVTNIGDTAFFECFDLTSMTIPDGVMGIGDRAFNYCDYLTSVTIIATGKSGASAANVKQAMIDAGVSENITWNMPS